VIPVGGWQEFYRFTASPGGRSGACWAPLAAAGHSGTIPFPCRNPFVNRPALFWQPGQAHKTPGLHLSVHTPGHRHIFCLVAGIFFQVLRAWVLSGGVRSIWRHWSWRWARLAAPASYGQHAHSVQPPSKALPEFLFVPDWAGQLRVLQASPPHSAVNGGGVSGTCRLEFWHRTVCKSRWP